MPDAGYRFEYSVDVRFRDVDALGNAHHTLPLIYFEEARGAYWRQVVGARGIEDIDFILGDVHVRYHARIFYPSRLSVRLRVSEMGRSSFTMEYELRDERGELLTTGRTVQVMYDYAAKRSKPIPPEVRARIEAFESGGSGTGNAFGQVEARSA